MKKLIFTLIILNFVSCSTNKYIIKNEKRNYLEDSKEYFKYSDYKKAIETAHIVINNKFSKIEQEEAYYIINESAEEIVTELKRKLYIESETNILKEINELKEDYDINIKFEKIGYDYILYYDKEYYYKLKELNSNSKFLRKILYRALARKSRIVTDPIYRFKQIKNVIEKYLRIYESHPEKKYIPSLLLRIADLYLYLYEQGRIFKKELNLSSNTLKMYYEKARKLYKKVKKEYPHSLEARRLAYVIESVRLREKPITKSKVIMRVQAGTLVKILERSERKVPISNMYDYWYKVKLISGKEGWIYGFYLRMNY